MLLLILAIISHLTFGEIPGVTIEEPSVGYPTIHSVAREVVFVGDLGEMALGELRFVRSRQEFIDIYGVPDSVTAHAVDSFFGNGGTRAYLLNSIDLDQTIYTLETIEYVGILSIPELDRDDLPRLRSFINDHNIFFILDIPFEEDPGQYVTDIEERNIATYYPHPIWKGKLVVPSGLMAAAYQRLHNIWKAPAGLHWGKLMDVEAFSGRCLDSRKINCLKMIDGEAYAWGARTLEEMGDFRYISISRLYNMVSRDIEVGLLWTLFEPKDESTCLKASAMVFDYLTILWRDGALLGAKPSYAFYVRCHVSELKLGIALLKPAEYIHLTVELK